jgi:hypothetical protein
MKITFKTEKRNFEMEIDKVTIWVVALIASGNLELLSKLKDLL